MKREPVLFEKNTNTDKKENSIVYDIDLKKLNSCKNYKIIVRLAWAVNDIICSNQFLGCLKSTNSKSFLGAKMYFVRLQSSHLAEGMKIIEKINTITDLTKIIDNLCSPKAKEAYTKLKTYLDCNHSNHEKYKKHILSIRNQLTFHYEENKTHIYEKALIDLLKRSYVQKAKITQTYGFPPRFCFADLIIDSIVCHQCWGIDPYSKSLQEEANKKSDFGCNVCLLFLDFALDFISQYLITNSLIIPQNSQ